MLPADIALGQCPPKNPGDIAWYQGIHTPGSWTLQWGPAPGATKSTVYEVLLATFPGYCAFNFAALGVVAATTDTTYTVIKAPETVYMAMVRLRSNPCVSTGYAILTDSFSQPPPRPVITEIDANADSASFSFSYADTAHTWGFFVERAGADGIFHSIYHQPTGYGFIGNCLPNPKGFIDGPGLPAGHYQYRLMTYNEGTGRRPVYSDAVAVVVGVRPSILSFTATQNAILHGQAATLSWSTKDAKSVTIAPLTGPQPTSGSLPVQPAATTTYTLTAMSDAASLSKSVTVRVAPLITFHVDPPAIVAGNRTTLSWTTEGASTVSIDQGLGPQRQLSGSLPISPLQTTTFTLMARSPDNVVSTASVTVNVSAPPTVVFAAVPRVIRRGQTSTLFWSSDAQRVSIADVGVFLGGSGRWLVTPPGTTTYVLTAYSGPASTVADATVIVIDDARVSVATFPQPMLQPLGTSGASTSYVLMNGGGAPAALHLEQSGTFFTQNPSTFTLSPGASQVVRVAAVQQQAAGLLEGAALLAGDGVPPGLRIPIRLLTTIAPFGPAAVRPLANRVEVGGPLASSPSGSVTFTNSGSSAISGVLAADAPWVIPQSGIVTIAPGATASASFVVDRTKRESAMAGSASAQLILSFLGGPAAAAASIATPASAGSANTSVIKVIDTIQPPVVNAVPPPLAPGEVALFVPGVGHVAGSVGIFVSDLSLLATAGSVSDPRLFYAAAGAAADTTRMTTLSPLERGAALSLSDAVKNVFSVEGEVGTLQIRSPDAAKLALNANIFNVSNPLGTYGTTIPIFRSDRAAAAGEGVVLVGLRHTASSHTNLFIQETKGIGVTVDTEFIGADGTSRGVRSDAVGAFGLAQINGAVPEGAVAAILTNRGFPAGEFLAYATPVDEASGDNWSVADWGRQYGYARGDARIIPVAGAVHGANSTFFHTEVAIMNTGGAAASGTLRFVSRGGDVADRQVTLGARQSLVIDDVIGRLFNITTDTVGYLRFTPAAGSFAVTSRTYTSVNGKPATYGASVPALPLSAALSKNAVRIIGALDDASPATVGTAVPATFRTNFGLVETSGKSVHVRVTLRFYFSSGAEVVGMESASKEYDVAPNQFLLLGSLTAEILGAERALFGDLRDVEADFQVTDGDGSVLVFTSSVDNGTGDSILRTE